MKRWFQAIVLLVIATGALAQDSAVKDPILDRAQEVYQKRVEAANEVLERAKKKHAEDVDAARKQLIMAYDEAIKRFTKRGELAPATVLLAKKKELEESSGDTRPGAGTAAPTSVVASGGGPTITLDGVIYACADDHFDMRINGVIAMSGDKGQTPNLPARLRTGDVITIKLTNGERSKGFMFFFQSRDKKRGFFSNTQNWFSYRPESPQKWWEVTPKPDMTKAMTAEKAYLNMDAGAGFGVESIWGSSEDVSHLVHVVERADLE